MTSCDSLSPSLFEIFIILKLDFLLCILGSFYCTRFPYHPSNAPHLYLFLCISSLNPISSLPLLLVSPFPLPQSIQGDSCAPQNIPLLYFSGSMDGRSVIISLMANIYFRVSIYHIFFLSPGYITQNDFFSCFNLPANFMTSFLTAC